MEDEQASNHQCRVMTMESSSVFIEAENENCNKELMESLAPVVGYKENKGFELNPHSPDNSVMEGELDFEDELDGKFEEDAAKERERRMSEDFQKESLVSKHFKEKEEFGTDEENEMSGKEDGQLSPENEEGKEGSIEEGEDDGELSDDDLEEGEVKDSLPAAKQQVRQVCRFFNRGQCTWGNLCRFLHLSVNDRGNYNMFAPSNKSVSYTPHSNALPMGPVAIPVHVSQRSVSRNISEHPTTSVSHTSSIPNEATPVESAWERGLRHAKEMVKKASRRKEQEPDFEEKRMNLSMEECHKGISSEYDKENDYYGKTVYRRQSDAVPFSKFEQTPDPYDKCEDEAKEHWHGGRFENFEIRWSKSDGSKGHREKELARNSKFSSEREKFPKQLQGNKWRDERLSEIQTTRSRADEWRDPWRRSKTPKGRRSRSRIRSRGSYSSVSSHSYSERSSHSSYSYSRSSSRSSFYSSRRSSSSRSVTRTPSRSRSRSRSRSYSRSLTMDSVSSASSSISHSSSRSDSAQNHRSDSAQNQNVDSTFKKRGAQQVNAASLNPRFDIRPSEEELFIAEGQAMQDYERLQGKQKKKNSSLNAITASSQSTSFLNDVKVHDKEQVVIKQEPTLKPQHVPPAIERPVKEQPKSLFLNKPIKLTLLNKGLSPKFPHVFRREPEFRIHEIPDEVPKVAIKRPLSPGKDKVVSNERKSASSRRDELLKQLKAVEDAIARKRAKFF